MLLFCDPGGYIPFLLLFKTFATSHVNMKYFNIFAGIFSRSAENLSSGFIYRYIAGESLTPVIKLPMK